MKTLTSGLIGASSVRPSGLGPPEPSDNGGLLAFKIPPFLHTSSSSTAVGLSLFLVYPSFKW